jgi:uncharacterized membrane protein YphA (DoxX/SURF4 family)
MSRSLIGWLCRIFLGALFIYAGAIKIVDPAGFAESIFRYQVLPGNLVNFVAITLPWLEVFIGLAVMLPTRLSDAAALWILLLLLVFTAAVAFNVWRGIDISCGCFTTNPKASRAGWNKVAENVGMIAAAVFALRSTLRRR